MSDSEAMVRPLRTVIRRVCRGGGSSPVFAVVLALLLCSTAVADGPLFSIWHIDGHGYSWQQAQIDAGYPVEPTVRMLGNREHEVDKPAYVAQLDAQASLLSQLNGRPIVLRMGNIGQEIDWTIPRVSPLTDETWRSSHMCVTRTSGGPLDATPTVSPWAGNTAWVESGRRWATSIWMVRLQQIIPTPAGLILRENNEGGRVLFASLYQADRPYYRKPNGSVAFAELATPPEQYTDVTGTPLTPDWIVYTGSDNKKYMQRWKPDAGLDLIDLRAKEWIAPRRGTLPTTHEAAFDALLREKYDALFAAFRDNLSPEWKAVWKGCCGYGSDQYHNADSPTVYTSYYADRPASLCHPQWNKYRDTVVASQANKAWREISIRLNGQTMYQSVLDGTGGFVDADSYACFNVHWAWALQAAGKDVRLVWWDNYNTPPSLVIPGSGTYRDRLIQLGRTDLTTMTLDQCEVAVMQRLQHIHSNPVLSEYWKRGTTRIMASPLNTTTVTKVYATETSIPGVSARLVCVYTPCDMTGLIQVEGLLLPAKRMGYYINGSAVEIE